MKDFIIIMLITLIVIFILGSFVTPIALASTIHWSYLLLETIIIPIDIGLCLLVDKLIDC